MFTVTYDLGNCGGMFDLDVNTEHEAYKLFLSRLEEHGLSLDDVEEFTLTPL
jgi:hypothetical protein